MESIYNREKREWEKMMIQTSGPNHGVEFHLKYLMGDAKYLEQALKNIESGK